VFLLPEFDLGSSSRTSQGRSPGEAPRIVIVDSLSTREDDRGVDVAQIRAQLRLTVPERVRVMVEAANQLLAVQDAAGLHRSVTSD
jgi:hypothetical protein